MKYFVHRVNFNATTGKQSNSTQTYTDLVQAQKRYYNILAADIDAADYSYELVQIIDERGLSEFKKIEEASLLSINADRTIISTGGSAVYYERAMEHLRSLGPVIYLYTSLDTVIRRIGDFSARGVALAPGQTIEDLYNERTALYKKYADITVDCDDDNFMEHQKQIINTICRRIASHESSERRKKK